MYNVPPLFFGGQFRTLSWQQSTPFVPGDKMIRVRQLPTLPPYESNLDITTKTKLTASSLAGAWLSFSIFSSLFC